VAVKLTIMEEDALVQGAAAADCYRSGSESRETVHIDNDDEEEGGEEGERAGRTNPAVSPD
jgi:hypothetical protein